MFEFFNEAILVSILTATIRIASPLIIAALGELISERAGVLNLGVEGTMLMGCFVAYYFAFSSDSTALAITMAILAGAVLGLLMAFLVVSLKLEQIIVGLVLNLFASGLTLYWFRALQQSSNTARPTIELMGTQPIPLLSDIPYLGEILFNQNIITYIAFLSVPLIWLFLYRTKYGLELRCIGENPKAIDMKGLSVSVRQYLAVMFGGAMAGLAGAFISVGASANFIPDMIAGRGWLAIVIVIAGNWRPKWIMVAAIVFAGLDSFRLHVQAVGIDLPYQLLLALPYIVAILAMMFSGRSSGAPAALGIPYFRSR